MTSWFTQSTGFDLNAAFDTLTETVQTVTESVSEVIPTEHKELLAKLTLNTDEMISERQNFGEEASRKEKSKDRLNKILPWGTLDPERELLVEECKEAILELSGREETFFGPYEMPLLNVRLENAESDDEQEESEGKEEDDGVAESTPPEVYEHGDQKMHMVPTEESLEMLAKLQPLPPLLEDFDLDAHVGLIHSVMKEDPRLVGMQAYFSGGGAREHTFWRNYFFHCAFVRYKTGLSLDEIWSYPDESNIASPVEDAPVEDTGDKDDISPAVEDGNEKGAIALDGGSEPKEVDLENTGLTLAEADTAVDLNGDGTTTTDSSFVELSELSPKNGFELFEEDMDGITDPELDDLEAEIARELGDM